MSLSTVPSSSDLDEIPQEVMAVLKTRQSATTQHRGVYKGYERLGSRQRRQRRRASSLPAPQPRRNRAECRTYLPTPNDLSKTFHLLHTQFLLPPELVLPILDHAHYWPKVHIRSDAHLDVFAKPLIIPPQWTTEADLIAVLDTYDLGATRTVLLTPPLGGWAGRSNVLPRAVAFTIKSHDQGWARPSERAYGYYRDSWTWFEAVIVRQFIPLTGQSLEPHGIISEQLAKEPYPRRQQVVTVARDRNGRDVEHSRDTWKVQRNRRGVPDAASHRVVWLNDGVDSSKLGDKWTSQGQGAGRGFVGSLQPGDRIALLARAKFDGWSNHVLSASVDLYYAL